MHSDLLAALRRGARVITANARLSRSLRRDYAEHSGARVWVEPDILPWSAWIEREWREHLYAGDAQPVLRPRQQAALWERIIRTFPEGDKLIDAPAAAALAADAWRLAADWLLPWDAPDWKRQEDSAAFHQWAEAYRAELRRLNRLDHTQLDDFVSTRFAPTHTGELWLTGFDELTPRQNLIVTRLEQRGWHVSRLLPLDDHPGNALRLELPDAEAEIEAAAAWAARRLAKTPATRIGVVFPRLTKVRTFIDRIFRAALGDRFHLSLGPTLSERPLIAAALRMLDLASPRVSFAAVSHNLLSPYVAGFETERGLRAQFDLALRAQRATTLSLPTILRDPRCPPLFAARLRALAHATGNLDDRQPSAWRTLFLDIFSALGWPGDQPLSSAEFQVRQRWTEALADFGALDLIHGDITFAHARTALRQIAEETQFEIENRGQPVQVMGVLEAAGSEFDYLWIGGADADSWPPAAAPNPFLPLSLQRRHGLPGANAARELDFARQVTRRLLASAPDITISHAASDAGRTVSPSPLFTHIAPHTGEAERFLLWQPTAAPAEAIDDAQGPPLPPGAPAAGGVNAISLQARCPFRSFGELRLGARKLERPEHGLDPRLRGSLVHRVLETCWRNLKTLDRLQTINAWELQDLIKDAAEAAVTKENLEPRMAELERRRLTRVAFEWLKLERERGVAFTAERFEQRHEIELSGLRLDTRIDRMDRLEDGRVVLIDYKSSRPRVSEWNGDRPDDPQVPVYATTVNQPVAGVFFGQVRADEVKFAGATPVPNLIPNIKPEKADAFDKRLADWRRVVQTLAAEHLDGVAKVEPKEKSKTCQHCHLQTLCRIHEKAMREEE